MPDRAERARAPPRRDRRQRGRSLRWSCSSPFVAGGRWPAAWSGSGCGTRRPGSSSTTSGPGRARPARRLLRHRPLRRWSPRSPGCCSGLRWSRALRPAHELRHAGGRAWRARCWPAWLMCRVGMALGRPTRSRLAARRPDGTATARAKLDGVTGEQPVPSPSRPGRWLGLVVVFFGTRRAIATPLDDGRPRAVGIAPPAIREARVATGTPWGTHRCPAASRPAGPARAPEYLEQGGGAPSAPPASPAPARRRGRRAVIAGGARRRRSRSSAAASGRPRRSSPPGPQPAEALPGLDARLRQHRPRPERRPEDRGDPDAAQVPRRSTTRSASTPTTTCARSSSSEIQERRSCEGLDYADDVEPWLGDRAAVAAVDTGEDEPAPGLRRAGHGRGQGRGRASATLRELRRRTPTRRRAAGPSSDDWAVIAETDEIAEAVVDDAADAPLAERRATSSSGPSEAGDAGIVSMYAAPAAGDVPRRATAGGMDRAAPVGRGRRPRHPGLGRQRGDRRVQGLQGRGGHGPLRRRRARARGRRRPRRRQVSAYGRATTATTWSPTCPTTPPRPSGSASRAGLVHRAGRPASPPTPASDQRRRAARQHVRARPASTCPEDAETLAGDVAGASALGSDFDPEALANSGDGSERPGGGRRSRATPRRSRPCSTRSAAATGRRAERPWTATSEGDVVAIGPERRLPRAGAARAATSASSDGFKRRGAGGRQGQRGALRQLRRRRRLAGRPGGDDQRRPTTSSRSGLRHERLAGATTAHAGATTN